MCIQAIHCAIALRFAKDGYDRLIVLDFHMNLHSVLISLIRFNERQSSISSPIAVILRFRPYDRCRRGILRPTKFVQSILNRSAFFTFRYLAM